MTKKTPHSVSRRLKKRLVWQRDIVIVFVLGMLISWFVLETEDKKTADNMSQSSAVESAQTGKNGLGEIAKVVRVIDGDTIVMENGETVRYLGIDTPELTHQPPDCFAQEAAQKNSALVLEREVRLVKDVRDKDRYARLLRYVYVNDIFINLELVKQGLARAFIVPPDIVHEEEFLKADQSAREEKVGLWGACDSKLLSIWERTTGERAETAEFLVTNNQPTFEDAPECYCEENIYDCKDFISQAEAQALYDCCLKQIGKDVHLIDADLNSRACERLK